MAKQQFPRAACLIDVIRLTLGVNTGDQILTAFEALQRHAEKREGFKIMRCSGACAL